jgi:hypothetical protein
MAEHDDELDVPLGRSMDDRTDVERIASAITGGMDRIASAIEAGLRGVADAIRAAGEDRSERGPAKASHRRP